MRSIRRFIIPLNSPGREVDFNIIEQKGKVGFNYRKLKYIYRFYRNPVFDQKLL